MLWPRSSSGAMDGQFLEIMAAENSLPGVGEAMITTRMDFVVAGRVQPLISAPCMSCRSKAQFAGGFSSQAQYASFFPTDQARAGTLSKLNDAHAWKTLLFRASVKRGRPGCGNPIIGVDRRPIPQLYPRRQNSGGKSEPSRRLEPYPYHHQNTPHAHNGNTKMSASRGFGLPRRGLSGPDSGERRQHLGA